jgi:hypothetical protein
MDILNSVAPNLLDQGLAWSKIHLPDQYQNILNYYKQHGEIYHLDWAMAFAQACHETGIFQFGGDVKPTQNNFAGIGATGNGVPGDSFSTISDGVLGQIQHLACYAGVDIPKQDLVAPRTKQVKEIILGKSTTWEGLSGTWAADPNYFNSLKYHYERIFQVREQNHGWYRLVETNGAIYFVAMSGNNSLFKYLVPDSSLTSIQDTCKQLLKQFPNAHNVQCDQVMNLSDVPDYQPGETGEEGHDSSNTWNDLLSTEPPYFWKRSPNFSQRDHEITHIILHNTAGEFWGAVSWLCNREAKASAHLVIPRSGGEIAALVNEKDAAWHAGSHQWNHCSIGIEIECANNQKGMTDVQEELVVQQVNHLLLKYNLTPDKVDIHRRVSRNPLPVSPTSQGIRRTDCPILIWETDNDFLQWRKQWYGV